MNENEKKFYENIRRIKFSENLQKRFLISNFLTKNTYGINIFKKRTIDNKLQKDTEKLLEQVIKYFLKHCHVIIFQDRNINKLKHNKFLFKYITEQSKIKNVKSKSFKETSIFFKFFLKKNFILEINRICSLNKITTTSFFEDLEEANSKELLRTQEIIEDLCTNYPDCLTLNQNQFDVSISTYDTSFTYKMRSTFETLEECSSQNKSVFENVDFFKCIDLSLNEIQNAETLLYKQIFSDNVNNIEISKTSDKLNVLYKSFNLQFDQSLNHLMFDGNIIPLEIINFIF